MDRSNDFTDLCLSFSNKNLPTNKNQSTKTSSSEELKQFSAAASDISKEVHLVSQRLKELTILARQNTMFNDPTEKINEITSIVKEDIQNINTQLDNLQSYINGRKTTKQIFDHSDLVINQMKSKLMNATKDFKDILQVRQENMKLQYNRRQRYGKPPSISLGKPARFNNNQNSTNGLPRPNGVSNQDEQNENVPLINNSNQAESSLQFQMEQSNPFSYAESRAEQVGQINSHIVELGTIFNRLAVMINEQGEMVQRIDDNVNESVININDGQNQLLKYYTNLSNNKMLMYKVVGILFIFFIFFMFFMA